jgi:hypothetical protein
MKNRVLLSLGIFSVLATSGQEADKNAKFYFYSSFNKQAESTRNAIAADSARKGIYIVTEFTVDTLNKNELIITSPEKETPQSSTINSNGVKIGVMPAGPGKYTPSSYYDYYMEGAVAVHADTCKLMAISKEAFYNNSAFFGFTVMFGKTNTLSTLFFEQSVDSTAIYRSTGSPKNLSRIEVAASLSNCYYEAWPASDAARLYGRGVLTTDAFYARDEHFTRKYILKRYTIGFVYRAPVHRMK